MIYTLDDDESFNFLLKSTLNSYGLEVKTHTNSIDFTASVKQEKPTLCIIDLNLEQQGEGFHLLKAIRKVIGNELPVIVMSRRSISKDVEMAMDYGASDFLPKPLDDQYLLIKLKKYFPQNEKLIKYNLDLIPVVKIHQSGVMQLDFKLSRIIEHEFVISSGYFLTKDSDLQLSGAIIKEIFDKDEMTFRVINCTLEEGEEKRYLATLSREYERHESFALRRWLARKNKEVNKEVS